jgi:predicted RNA-binding Zn ribbon-like protein
VRGGGRQTPSGFLFELSGGALCLDFVNTVDDRPTLQSRELLHDYRDLLSWARQAGAVTPRQASALEREAARRPREARSVLDQARSVRESLFLLFSAAAAGRRLPEAELDRLNPALSAALGRLRLTSGRGKGARWAWSDELALEQMLWPVLRSAADLLTSRDLARLRECAAQACAWLFLDRSKNRSRRWCDMTVCGNRDKVRRHRQRRRERRG